MIQTRALSTATAAVSTDGTALAKVEEQPLEQKIKVEERAPMMDKPYIHSDPRSYKGRLGYACLNTILRKQKPPVFCSRTCRLDTLRQKGMDFVKELALKNVEDIKALIEWNEAHGIKFMRISSEIFPFASHDDHGYSLEFAAKELREVGDLAAKYNHRLTTHPGQYNQLVSPNPDVVRRTVKDLGYHAEMLDLMGLPADSIMIIHMGGVYGDRASALQRFEEEYKKLPERIKRRLVLENDELGYSVSDLLPICQKLNIPLVLDWHHHSINPGNVEDLPALVPAINETWKRKGMKPKQHYSESRPGAVSAVERRAHSDRVMNLPPSMDDVDLMIEAKEKEQAVLQLYKMYDLYPVNEDDFVPATEYKPKERKKPRRKVKAEEAVCMEMETEPDDSSPPTTPRRSQRQRKTLTYTENEEVDMEPAPTLKEDEKPKKRKARVVKKAIRETQPMDVDEVDNNVKPTRKSARQTKKKS